MSKAKRQFCCDPCTFGGSKAAQTLAKELNALDDAYLLRKVGRMYVSFCHYLNQLLKTDKRTQKHLTNLLWQQGKQQVWDLGCPSNIKTFLLNVMGAKHKSVMKGNQ